MDLAQWDDLFFNIRDFVEIVSEPYFAPRCLGASIRLLLVLEGWTDQLQSLGLERLKQEAEWEHQAALAFLAGDPLHAASCHPCRVAGK